MNLDNVIKQGYLKKTTQARRLSMLFKRDVKRWFIFGVRDRQPYLEYYEKEESIFREPPINVFDLSECKQITYTLSNRNPVYTFSIVWEHNAMELSAYTRADMLDWCSKLENALLDLDIIAIGQVRGEDTEHVYVDADFLKRKKEPPEEPAPTRPVRRTQSAMPQSSPIRVRAVRESAQTSGPSASGPTPSASTSAPTREVILLPTRRSWDCTVENKNYDNMLFNDDARLPTASANNPEEGMSKSKSFDTAKTLKFQADNSNSPFYQNTPPILPASFQPVVATEERKLSLELRDSGMGRSENSDENNDHNEETVTIDEDARVYDYESICEWSTLQSDWANKEIPNHDAITPKNSLGFTVDTQNQNLNFPDDASNQTMSNFQGDDFRMGLQSNFSEGQQPNSPPKQPLDPSVQYSIVSKNISDATNVNLTTQVTHFDNEVTLLNHVPHTPMLIQTLADQPLQNGGDFLSNPGNTYVIMPGDYSESETDGGLTTDNSHNDVTMTEGSTNQTVSYSPIIESSSASEPSTPAPSTEHPTTSGAFKKPIHMSLRGRFGLLEDPEAQKNIQLLLATCRSRGSSTSSSVSGDTTGSYRHDSSSSSLATTYEDGHTGATDEYLTDRGNDSDSYIAQDRVAALPVVMEHIHEDESESSAGSVMTVISQTVDGGIVSDVQKRSPKRFEPLDIGGGLQSMQKPIPQPRTSALNSPKSAESGMVLKYDAPAPPLPSRTKSLDSHSHKNIDPIQRKSDPTNRLKLETNRRPVPDPDDFPDIPTTSAPPIPSLRSKNLPSPEDPPPIPARRVTSRFTPNDPVNDPPIPDEVAPLPPRRRTDSGNEPPTTDDKGKWKGISPGIISQLEGSLYLTNTEDDDECLVSNFLSFVQTGQPGANQTQPNGDVPAGAAAASGTISPFEHAMSCEDLQGACAMPSPVDETPPSTQSVKRSLSNRQQVQTHSSAQMGVPLRQTQADMMRQQIESITGIYVKLKKADCIGVIAFVDCFNSVWVAGWNKKNKPCLHDAFHIGDQLVTINAVVINNSNDAQKAIKQSESDTVVFMVRRTPHAKIILVHRSRDGQNLGIRQVGGTAEIAYVDLNGLSAQFGLPAKASCLSDQSKTCTWMLTEVNNRPLNLSFKGLEIDQMLNAMGKDILLVVQPSQLILELKKQMKHLRGYRNYLV